MPRINNNIRITNTASKRASKMETGQRAREGGSEVATTNYMEACSNAPRRCSPANLIDSRCAATILRRFFPIHRNRNESEVRAFAAGIVVICCRSLLCIDGLII